MGKAHICLHQGCSVRFFGSKGSIKFVKFQNPQTVRAVRCANSKMEDFAGFHGHTCILVMNAEKIRMFHGHLRFYFACIMRCIGLCHYYQGRLQSWLSSAWPWLEANYWQ